MTKDSVCFQLLAEQDFVGINHLVAASSNGLRVDKRHSLKHIIIIDIYI